MRDVYDFAKFFLKNGADATPNTYDGNMKLQKLLVLANMIHIAEHGEPLFEDDIFAFENGPVVEKVRLRYKKDYFGLKLDSERYNPDFKEDEYDSLNAALGIYGQLSAKELSALSHTFNSWKQAYKKGTAGNGYHNKESSIINIVDYPEDIEAVRKAVRAYRETKKKDTKHDVINGVVFYYDDDIEMSEQLIAMLEKFAEDCEDEAYNVCKDGERLVIY